MPEDTEDHHTVVVERTAEVAVVERTAEVAVMEHTTEVAAMEHAAEVELAYPSLELLLKVAHHMMEHHPK